MYCFNCGEKVKPHQKFCPHCGAYLKEEKSTDKK